jgi:hypothetical protein
MVITDLFTAAGSKNTQFFLVDGANDIMFESACEIVDTVRGLNKVKLTDYPNNAVKMVAQLKEVKSSECSDNDCEDWGVTRMIYKNKANDDFWSCGFAIMGYPVVCPPSNK